MRAKICEEAIFYDTPIDYFNDYRVVEGRNFDKFMFKTKAKKEILKTSNGKIILPRMLGIYLANKYNIPIEYSLHEGEDYSFNSNIQLREGQKQFVQDMIEGLKENYGVIGLGRCGSGKTVCALETANKIGKKFIVLVHAEFLAKQWEERIKSFLGIEAGRIQGNRYEIDKPIVVAMAQTVVTRNYTPSLFKDFGLLIIDEVHRFSCDLFEKSIIAFNTRYRLGLTATPRRSDGLEKVFKYHIGRISGKIESDLMEGTVNLIETPCYIYKNQFCYYERYNLAKLLNILALNDRRNNLICKYLNKAINKGRKILVLSDRILQLKKFHEIFKNSALFTGMQSEKEKEKAKSKQVILGTFQLAKEGLDIPELDTLFLATPKSSIIQPAGRILREHPGKKHPVIIDFVDQDEEDFLHKMSVKRIYQYRRLGFKINYIKENAI